MNTKSKTLTVFFSLIPGAGHMYLGLMKKGTGIMGLFFFSICLISWVQLEILGFALPVIWFYSFFDALHCLENDAVPEELSLEGFTWLRSHPRWIAWGLIVLGVLVAFEQGFSALIPWEWRHYIQTGLVSVILIAGGFKLLLGSKADDKKEGLECDNGE